MPVLTGGEGLSRALMLDVDGVLVMPRREGGWTATLEADLGVRPEVLRDHFFHPYWPEVVTGRRALMPALERALAAMGASVTAEVLREYWFAQDRAVVAEVLADVDVLRAEGWRVWLATNQEHERAGYLMRTLGLAAHVEGMVYSADVGARKPEPAFYAACEAVAGPCMLVDDTAANVRAARGAGWPAVQWPTGRGLAQTVRDLEGLG